MSIQVLPHNIRDQIAAGEVVERPASVVKECIENALDAGSTNIEVTLEEGGKKRIVILDNGTGIKATELELAVERHATSKIKSIDDLFAIQHFGFRGEALSAIAAVSDFTITSKTKEAQKASQLTVYAGRKEPIQTVAHPKGTTIEIKNLFAPTPARLQYLKTSETEYRQVLKTIQQFALAHPHVGFRLNKEAKTVLDLPTGETARTRAETILKLSKNQILDLDFGYDNVKISGFICASGYCARSRNHQFLFVNGRPIEDSRMAYAIREGYVQSAGIEKHLHPIFALNIELDPLLVDVNVHPRKLEVKFAEPGEVFVTVKKSVMEALRSFSEMAALPPIQHKTFTSPPPKTPQKPTLMLVPKFSHNFASRNTQREQRIPRLEKTNIEPAPETPQSLRVIGQVDKKYIIAESEKGMYIFDQHALHERQRFEQFWNEWKTSKIKSETLLVPQVLSMNETQISVLAENTKALNKLGFKINFTTDSSVEFLRVPTVLKDEDLQKIAELMVNYFDTEKLGEHVLDQVMRKALEYKACRGSIMFGDRLDIAEMEKLIADFDSTSWKLLCPHGRPNHTFIPFSDLDQQFHR